MIKKILYILLAIAMMGCEVIKEEERLMPVSPSELDGRRHVLVEFTGFRCVNCPDAAALAQEMKNLCGEQLIVVSAHPATNPFTQGLFDYTCPAADSLYLSLGGTATTPFPTGNINLCATENTYLIDPSEWMATLLSAMMTSENYDLRIEAVGHEGETEEDPSMAVFTLHYPTLSDMQCAVWIIEDSVAGVQAMPDGTVNTHYMHRHVLRGIAGESVWGTPIGETSEMTIEMNLDKTWNTKQLHAVALLIDTEHKIRQAYETSIDFNGN